MAVGAPSPPPPWIHVTFGPAPWPPALAKEVERDLRAGLARQGMALRVGGSSPATRPGGGVAPVASIRLDLRGVARVALSIEVRDAVTQKRVLRDINLSQTPKLGRSAAVALAVEELLRASWAEIALVSSRRRAQARAVPKEVRASVRAALKPPVVTQEPGPRWRVGARFALDAFSGGVVQLGGDAFLRFHLGLSRFGIELSAGVRSALLEQAHQGEVGATAAVVGGALTLRLLDRGSWALASAAELQLLVLHGFGRSDTDPGRELSKTLLTGVAAARLSLEWRPAPHLALGLSARVGAVLSGIALADGPRRVTAMEGVAGSGAVSVTWAF